jgi:hypothetical protein
LRILLSLFIFFNLPSVAIAYHGNTRDSYREYSPQADSLDKRIMDTLRLTCGEGIVGNVTHLETGGFKVECD